MNFRDRFVKFMYGRYGMDTLWYGILGVCIAMAAVNLVVRSVVLQVVEAVLIVWAFYRIFSKNTTQRQKENAYFEKLLHAIRFQFRRIKECRTHVYRRCPHCKKMLRFPRKRGQHTATCPMCHETFVVRVRF